MKFRLGITGTMLLVFAVTGAALQAQDHGSDQDHHDQDHHDQGGYNQNRNQHNQDHRDQGRSRFDDHDRQVSHDWYNQHRDRRPAGFRDRDRLPSDYESRLQEGYVLDRNMRGRIRPMPSDYYRQLSAAPRGYRYVIIGGHVVMIDSGYRVHDVIHFEMNF